MSILKSTHITLSIGVLCPAGKESSLAILGAKQALAEFGLPFELISSEAEFPNCPVVLIPSSEFLGSISPQTIDTYLNSGGKLVVCGDTHHLNNLSLLGVDVEGVIETKKARLKVLGSQLIPSRFDGIELPLYTGVLLLPVSQDQRPFAELLYDGRTYSGAFLNSRENIVFFPFNLCEYLRSWKMETYAGNKKKSGLTGKLLRVYGSLPNSLHSLWYTEIIMLTVR